MTVRTFLILSVGLMLGPVAAAEDEASNLSPTVIVHYETVVEGLKSADLAAIYLGRKSTWASGRRIILALPAASDSVTKVFIRQVLHKSVSQFRAYWRRRLFSGGGGLPKTLRSSSEVLEFVAGTPGAIGVIDESVEIPDESVWVVDITN